MQIDDEIRQEILHHARRAAALTPPEEMAGIVRDGIFLPMVNNASDRANHFALDAAVLATPVDAIVHSHPGGLACPSADDMAQQHATGVPWIIAVVPTATNPDCLEDIFVFDGVARLPKSQGYRHGVNDCYSLIRGFYAEKIGIILPDYPRDWEWWHDGKTLYEDYFTQAGFVGLGSFDTPKFGDIFLASIRAPTPNHGGILLESGLIWHHLAGSRPYDPSRLPRKEPVLRWHKYIHQWLRHKHNPSL